MLLCSHNIENAIPKKMLYHLLLHWLSNELKQKWNIAQDDQQLPTLGMSYDKTPKEIANFVKYLIESH